MITPIIAKAKIKEVRNLVSQANKVVITTHMSPDGDAVGSSLALYGVLTELGKDVQIVTPDEAPKQLAFLPKAKEIVAFTKYRDFAIQLIAEADLIFCLDFNSLMRIDHVDEFVEQSSAKKILIDHHLNPDAFTDVVISHPEQSSTCVLLFKVLCQAEYFQYIDKQVATCLLAGMMTDTGNFTYNCNDADDYVIVSELLRRGADKVELYKRLFNTYSENCLKLNGYAISEKMKVWDDHHAALITLTRNELNRYHYSKGDTEGLVNRPLAIPGVIYSAFLREEDNYIKVSMRSVGDFHVDRLCSDHFGGGGHKNAAGGEFKGTMKEAVDLFEKLLTTNIQQYTHNPSDNLETEGIENQ